MAAYPDGLDEHLRERILAETGIATRHFAFDLADPSRRETNTSMAERAARRALEAAGWRPEEVELLVVTTVVPDRLMPPTSTLVCTLKLTPVLSALGSIVSSTRLLSFLHSHLVLRSGTVARQFLHVTVRAHK